MNVNNPIKNSRRMSPWMIVYPLFIYFGICQILNMILPVLVQIDEVKRLGINNIVAFLVLYIVFICPPKKENGLFTAEPFLDASEQKSLFFTHITGHSVRGICVAIALMSAAGIAFNNVLAMIEVKELSESYQMVEQAFYAADLMWELLVLGIVTPLVEEVLYRYLIFLHLKKSQGIIGAVCLTAVIFGVMHFNIVQTLYASALGMLLGALMAYYDDIRVPVVGHMAANLIVLLRSETGILEFLSSEKNYYIPVTVVLLVLILAVSLVLFKKLAKNCADK